MSLTMRDDTTDVLISNDANPWLARDDSAHTSKVVGAGSEAQSKRRVQSKFNVSHDD